MSSRILGMGDMLKRLKSATRLRRTKSSDMAEKIKENSFDFNDFDQMDQLQNMGPLEDIMKMIPGWLITPTQEHQDGSEMTWRT